MKSHNKLKGRLFSALILIASVVAFCLIYLFSKRDILSDLNSFASSEYDTVFISSFDIDNFDSHTFSFYLAQNTIIAKGHPANKMDLSLYFKSIFSSANNIGIVYLGVEPEKISADFYAELASSNPEISFKLFLPFNSIDYWRKLPGAKQEKILSSYQDFSNALLDIPNISVFLTNDEWILCNPDCYDNNGCTLERVSELILFDTLYPNQLTRDNIASDFEILKQLIDKYTSSDYSLPDFSNSTIIFLGDSIFGNFTDYMSINGIVHALTGAKTFNLGYGGITATYIGEGKTFPALTASLSDKDYSDIPLDGPLLEGMTAFSDEYEGGDLTFVINYGLNDYFKGCQIDDSTNKYNISTYSGALRQGIQNLKAYYPGSTIAITTPNFCTYFSNGTVPQSELGGLLVDYADAVRNVALEENCILIDNYAELGINKDNAFNYLSDGCHPNEKTRFIMANRIIDSLNK